MHRDLSIVTAAVDDELLGDRARSTLGPDADMLESLSVRAVTDHEHLPAHVRERLGTQPGQANVLVRIVLRPIDRALTDPQANAVRDRVYAALHRGPVMEWATAPSSPVPAAKRRRPTPSGTSSEAAGAPDYQV